MSKISYNNLEEKALPFIKKAHAELIFGLDSKQLTDSILESLKTCFSIEIRKDSSFQDAFQMALAKVTSEIIASNETPALGIELFRRALNASGIFTETKEVYDSTPGWLTAVYVIAAIAGILFLCAILVPLAGWLMIHISNLIGIGM